MESVNGIILHSGNIWARLLTYISLATLLFFPTSLLAMLTTQTGSLLLGEKNLPTSILSTIKALLNGFLSAVKTSFLAILIAALWLFLAFYLESFFTLIFGETHVPDVHVLTPAGQALFALTPFIVPLLLGVLQVILLIRNNYSDHPEISYTNWRHPKTDMRWIGVFVTLFLGLVVSILLWLGSNPFSIQTI